MKKKYCVFCVQFKKNWKTWNIIPLSSKTVVVFLIFIKRKNEDEKALKEEHSTEKLKGFDLI